ncbi:MAG: hypothetical protein RMA76_11495 [Deltaproteobacteria bacterium]|jgi:hypothetical protein
MKLRTHLTAGLLALGALAPATALASTSHFLELQFSSSSVATVVQKRLNSDQSQCPFTVPCGWSPSNTCYVDHYDVPTPGNFSRGSAMDAQVINNELTLSSQRVLFTQGLQVHLKTVECADTPGCSTTVAVPVTLEGHVTLANDELCVEVDSFQGAPPNVPAPNINACVGLSGSSILDSLDMSNVQVSGSAFSLSSSGDRIALRTEVAIPSAFYQPTHMFFDQARVNAWQSFIDGSLAPAVGTGDWRGFLHKELLEEKFEQIIDDFVASDSSMLSASAAQLFWLPLGTAGAGATVTSDLVVHAGPCEIDVELEVPLTIAKNNDSNGLQLSGQINYDASDWDLFACGAQTGDLFAGLVTLIAGQFIDIDLASQNGACSTTSNGALDCNLKTHPQTMNFGFGHMAVATLTSVIGDGGGLFMSGPLAVYGPAAPSTQVLVHDPKVGLRGNCNSATCSTEGGVYVKGDAKICELGLTGDIDNLFDVTIPTDLKLPADIEIKLKPGVTDAQILAYNSAPYPLHAKVVTTAGANTYAVQPVLLTDADKAQLCGFYKILQIIHCIETKPPVWENPYDRWKSDWLIDPYIDVAAEIFEYAGNPFDLAIVRDVDIHVTWVRGLVDTVTISGVLHSEFKSGGLMQQELLIDVPGVRGLRASTEAEVVDAVLLNGFAPTVDIDRALLPRGVAAYAEFFIPGEMLMEAAAR